jgi:hypothetical protein
MENTTRTTLTSIAGRYYSEHCKKTARINWQYRNSTDATEHGKNSSKHYKDQEETLER